MYSQGYWQEIGSLDLLKFFNQTSVSHKMLLSLVKTKHLSPVSMTCPYPQQGDGLGQWNKQCSYHWEYWGQVLGFGELKKKCLQHLFQLIISFSTINGRKEQLGCNPGKGNNKIMEWEQYRHFLQCLLRNLAKAPIADLYIQLYVQEKFNSQKKKP